MKERDRKFLDTFEVMELLHISRWTLYRLKKKGLRTYRIGDDGRRNFYDIDEVYFLMKPRE